MAALLLLIGALLALWSGRQARRASSVNPLSLCFWVLGGMLVAFGTGLAFRSHGMTDLMAMAFAAGLAFGWGSAAGLALARMSGDRPLVRGMGLAMAFGMPPFGAFAGLWLLLHAIQAALQLLPAPMAGLSAAGGLSVLVGGIWAVQGAHGAETHGAETQGAETPALTEAAGLARTSAGLRDARLLLLALGVAGTVFPWIWVLPAQLAVETATGELPTLLVALGMMLTPVIPGQASVIPFGLLAIALAFSSVLLLVLRLTRRAR